MVDNNYLSFICRVYPLKHISTNPSRYEDYAVVAIGIHIWFGFMAARLNYLPDLIYYPV